MTKVKDKPIKKKKSLSRRSLREKYRGTKGPLLDLPSHIAPSDNRTVLHQFEKAMINIQLVFYMSVQLMTSFL